MIGSWIESLSPDAQTAFWTLAVAIACSVMCALLGVWMVLQRVSMLGDAISHSVLPGLVVTFLLFGTKESVPMFIGAALAGLATVLLSRAISVYSGVRDDASMGVVFTVLFAIGVILITRYARQVDLDPGCVLYGLIEFAALDTFRWSLGPLGEVEPPRALLTLVPALFLSAAFLFAFRKELLVMAFDPGLAQALGKRPQGLYYALMSIVAIATVASFEAVGSILVIAMLIGPAATAQLLSRKLRVIFLLAVVLAVVSSVAGYYAAVYWNTSIAGMMSVTVGLLYAVAVVFSPSGGVLLSLLERGSRRREIQDEDCLAALYRQRERGEVSSVPTLRKLLGDHWFHPNALRRLQRSGRVYAVGDQVQLSGRGVDDARKLVRRHRLLESFFVDELQKEAGDVHERAHLGEHYLDNEGEREVAARIVKKADPHGREIP